MARTYLALSFILLPAFLLLTSPGAKGQTCMVHCGTAVNGSEMYMEVFEYDYVTEKPQYPGGEDKLLNFVNKTREYPEAAYKAGIQGKVICSFVVNPDGSVGYIRVFRGVEPSLNAEAVRIISKMPAWKPGKLDGKTVPVRVFYAINFRK